MGIAEDTGGSAQAAQQVAAHQQAVEQVTTKCSDITMMLADASEPDWAELEYAFTAQAIETESGSGLLWQRYPTDDDQGHTTTALTLMTQHEGHAIMVAFIGSEEIADAEFTDNRRCRPGLSSGPTRLVFPRITLRQAAGESRGDRIIL